VIQGQPRQSTPDYSLAKCLIEGSEPLCQSTLAQPLDITHGQRLLSRVQFARYGQMDLCPAKLTNGMSFDLIADRPRPVRSPDSVVPRRGGNFPSTLSSNEVSPKNFSDSFPNHQDNLSASNIILADKGSQALVFVKAVGDPHDQSESQSVYSVFVGGNLYEAIPSSNWQQSKYRSRVEGLEHFVGVCCTEISSIAQNGSTSAVSFINGTVGEVSDADRLKKGFVLILWNARDDDDQFKLVTAGGAFDAKPPHNEPTAASIERRKLITEPVAPADPLEWSRSGWRRSLPGPTSDMMVSVAYPVEFQQAAAAAADCSIPSFDCTKWIGKFTWGMRELWWHLVTEAKPSAMILNADVSKTAVPKMPVLKSDPAPALPKTYLTGEAQLLVSIERIGQTRKVNAKILKSTLPENYNQLLVQSIETNSDNAIFSLPDLPQFDKASFLVKFQMRGK
jgi:hypothetical protein